MYWAFQVLLSVGLVRINGLAKTPSLGFSILDEGWVSENKWIKTRLLCFVLQE